MTTPRWKNVKWQMVKLSDPIANPAACTAEYLGIRAHITKQNPFMHSYQVTGELGGNYYYANGWTAENATSNMEVAAGVFLTGPHVQDREQ